MNFGACFMDSSNHLISTGITIVYAIHNVHEPDAWLGKFARCARFGIAVLAVRLVPGQRRSKEPKTYLVQSSPFVDRHSYQIPVGASKCLTAPH